MTSMTRTMSMNRNALGNGDDESGRPASTASKIASAAECRRHEDHRRDGSRLGHGLGHRVEHRHAFNGLTTAAGSDTATIWRAVIRHCLVLEQTTFVPLMPWQSNARWRSIRMLITRPVSSWLVTRQTTFCGGVGQVGGGDDVQLTFGQHAAAALDFRAFQAYHQGTLNRTERTPR